MEKAVTSSAERCTESSVLSVHRSSTQDQAHEESTSLPSKLLEKCNDELESNCGSLTLDANNGKSKQQLRDAQE